MTRILARDTVELPRDAQGRQRVFVPDGGDLLALDPSARSPGAALFRGGRLVAAGRVKLERYEGEHVGHVGDRWLRVASSIVRWAQAHRAEPRALVYERPQVDSRTRKINPDDLFGLPAIGGCIAGILAMGLAARDVGLVVLAPSPTEWCLGTSKSTRAAEARLSTRARLILGRLDAAELLIVPPQHDAIDAVGLGLWGLGRLEPVQVYPGASSIASSRDASGR